MRSRRWRLVLAACQKVNKIFGPGNSFVTMAKQLLSQSVPGLAIDMPAGPSEVLVIADSGANPEFIAADLLSQAEHGRRLASYTARF